jgi:hypothetical protein
MAGAGEVASVAGSDPLAEALGLVQGAVAAGVGLKLLGGLAVRVLCPGFPPRQRSGQDIDLACLSRERSRVASYLEAAGCQADRRFNMLNGDRQMYFTAPSGRPVDVMVDRLSMCHVLDFRPSFPRLPFTLDAMDLLLSKLQIVELNEKDVHDIIHLLAGVPLAGGDGGRGGPAAGETPAVPGGDGGRRPAPVTGGGDEAWLDTGRFAKLLGADWGWWRTVTGNLAKLPALVADRPALVPPVPAHDPLAAAGRLLEVAEAAPKTMKWKLRANIGERVRWYELPEEVAH